MELSVGILYKLRLCYIYLCSDWYNAYDKCAILR